MVVELVGATSIDYQCTFGAIGPVLLTLLTGILKKISTDGARRTGVKCFMWIVAIRPVMNATAEHVPRTIPGNPSGQKAVAFVVLLSIWEGNLFPETIGNDLLEFSESCCERK